MSNFIIVFFIQEFTNMDNLSIGIDIEKTDILLC